MAGLFTKKLAGYKDAHESTVKVLHEKIGQLTVDRDFWPKPSANEPQPKEWDVLSAHRSARLGTGENHVTEGGNHRSVFGREAFVDCPLLLRCPVRVGESGYEINYDQ